MTARCWPVEASDLHLIAHADGREAAVSGEVDKNATDPASPLIPPTPAAPAAPAQSFFDRYKIFIMVGVLILVAIAAGFGLGRHERNAAKNQNRLVLYGNV